MAMVLMLMMNGAESAKVVGPFGRGFAQPQISMRAPDWQSLVGWGSKFRE